ncbi:MAG TPA: hypothetical protein VN795_01775 [Stellaceae bacterium]|nr:hypothetical protein [Stellaceae bacterium]
MTSRFSRYAVLAAVLLLGGCSYADDLFGTHLSSTSANTSASRSNSTPAGQTTIYQIPASSAESSTQPLLNSSPGPGSSLSASAGSSSGTIVGQKVQGLRADLARLRANLAQHQQDMTAAHSALQTDSTAYFSTVAGINAKLQAGTTAGNPQLVAQWNQAQTTLDKIGEDIGRLNGVSTQAAADSSFAAYLLNATRSAFSLQGAVDEDHRQLTQIQGDVDTTTVQIDALLNALSDEIGRQSTYVANERDNLITLSQAIKNGQLYGPSLATRAFGPVTSAPLPPPGQPRAAAARPQAAATAAGPLVVIRFDRPDVSYEQALYTAVSRALERKPSATFELVAVAPNAGNSAEVAVNANASKRNAENVMRSLTSMGLPADRVSLSATTSGDIQNNEVRVYVR